MDDDTFWENLEALDIGGIPQLEEDVVVLGYPTGGDNISVTRGVVSRVDIQRYSHSGASLLAIQVINFQHCLFFLYSVFHPLQAERVTYLVLCPNSLALDISLLVMYVLFLNFFYQTLLL